MGGAIRFRRTQDESSEILTVVRVDGDPDLLIEVCAGPDIGDDFVGLYDLDGEQLPIGNGSWQAVDESEVPSEVVTAIETDWASGLASVERLA